MSDLDVKPKRSVREVTGGVAYQDSRAWALQGRSVGGWRWGSWERACVLASHVLCWL